ncbi:hypothetical protein [Parvicella tangerina]|uniref:Uncharacterized protein n=1 Tax=Parvicella tangerina TaxID=2829795 RepID=A0A916JPJ0_9FLAO|nr:hypothetical protein [Parvicella tangerina]CAG5085489.1 hypothetical protein CRYO30217_02772 [Parvicella tangerina]
MITKYFDKDTTWSRAQLLLFVLGFIIVCIPLFSMDYLITLDGPNHLYSSGIFYKLLQEQTVYNNYIGFNSEFTPNYFTVIILGALQKVFSGSIALKIFHFLHIILLLSGAYFWSNAHASGKRVYPFLVLPFVYSYLFFSGFYNFIFSVSFLLWVLGFYERMKNKAWRAHHFFILGALLFITYSTHIISFFFVGLYLAIDQLIVLKNHHWNKDRIRHSFYLLFASSPGLILTFLFMGSRQAEYNWIELSELIQRLTSGFSIVIKNETSEELTAINWSKLITLALALMLFIYQFFAGKKSWSLVITTISILVLYFLLPDSVGYASVFSVRIEYIFWLFIIIGATRAALLNNYTLSISAIAGLGLLIFQVNANLPYWKMLNGHAKSIFTATQHVENNTVVYPVFNSLIWDDYHISNIMGTTGKDIMILENTSARQDYFPITYLAPFEKCLQTTMTSNYECNGYSVKIDYLLIVGKYQLDPSNKLAVSLYSLARNEGEVVFEDDFVQLLKLPTHQN